MKLFICGVFLAGPKKCDPVFRRCQARNTGTKKKTRFSGFARCAGGHYRWRTDIIRKVLPHRHVPRRRTLRNPQYGLPMHRRAAYSPRVAPGTKCFWNSATGRGGNSELHEARPKMLDRDVAVDVVGKQGLCLGRHMLLLLAWFSSVKVRDSEVCDF